jgi:oligoribonuclease
MAKKEFLIWMDLEMTGLNPEIDTILEIATIITDNNLNTLATGPSLIIHQPESSLALMDNWVRTQHTKTGLVDAVQKSSITVHDAAEQTLEFIKDHCELRAGILAGNSIWQDRNFLVKYMPQITNYLHYRLVDVSSIKDVIQRWYPTSPYVRFKKPDNHRALEDVQESIKELAHYKTHFFVS